eukprot:scaffold21974_cov38-Phaeocystis_antarctica.AAC.1
MGSCAPAGHPPSATAVQRSAVTSAGHVTSRAWLGLGLGLGSGFGGLGLGLGLVWPRAPPPSRRRCARRRGAARAASAARPRPDPTSYS